MITYVIHYNKLTERKEYLQSKLPQAMFIDSYGQNDLTIEQELSYNPDPHLWRKKCEGMYTEIPSFAKMTKGMISCTIGHRETLKLINKLKTSALVLEDDAILCHDFEYHFNNIHQYAKDIDWDIIFLGGAFPHTITKTIRQYGPFLLKDHPASNTVCAYLIKPNIAGLIAAKLETFTLPVDFEVNYIMKEYNMNVWHVQPYLIREGTSAGFYKSSQERI